MNFNADFKFNRAGQGCFYTGLIKNEHNRFSMVYDCGTRSTGAYLSDEIVKFKSYLSDSDNVLNMLIISHFDQDHVNQVDKLLRGLKRIDRVILPYLSPEERLYLYFQSRSAEDGEDAPFGAYTSFMTDPVKFLRRYKVKEIIFIGNGGDNSNDNNNTINPENPTNGLDGAHWNESKEVNFRVNDRDLKLKRLPAPSEYSVAFKKTDGNREIGFYAGGKIFIEQVWEFIFYSQPVKTSHRAKVGAFRKAVEAKFSAYKKAGLSKNLVLADIFKNYGEFGKLYKAHFKEKKLNFSSIIVYHLPVEKDIDIWCEDGLCWYIDINQSATLLMGDAELKGLTLPAEIDLSLVKVCQIPHHGAETNWSPTIFKKIKESAEELPIAVFNFGLGNPDRHPRPTVVNLIARKFAFLTKTNTQLQSFSYVIKKS